MAHAEAEIVEPDIAWAKVHLKRAREFAEDAGHRNLSNATRQVLYYQSCVAVMEGVIQADGRRIKQGTGYHRVLREQAERLLEPMQADLFERLEDARAGRVEASYYAGVASEDDVRVVSEIAEELVELGQAFIDKAEAQQS